MFLMQGHSDVDEDSIDESAYCTPRIGDVSMDRHVAGCTLRIGKWHALSAIKTKP